MCIFIYLIRYKLKKHSIRVLLVRITGLEPARMLLHKILSLARLPIPPYPHEIIVYTYILSKKIAFVNFGNLKCVTKVKNLMFFRMKKTKKLKIVTKSVVKNLFLIYNNLYGEL